MYRGGAPRAAEHAKRTTGLKMGIFFILSDEPLPLSRAANLKGRLGFVASLRIEKIGGALMRPVL